MPCALSSLAPSSLLPPEPPCRFFPEALYQRLQLPTPTKRPRRLLYQLRTWNTTSCIQYIVLTKKYAPPTKTQSMYHGRSSRQSTFPYSNYYIDLVTIVVAVRGPSSSNSISTSKSDTR
ncbi:hypothetical protein N7G274_010539 [Stereocaulon virgatum]|uniref:Uncharacterized protein n=1 Tax=Stereocaulon virgatum TaxID=373712 RepID=A0ABR3ZUF2_9LECA